MTTPTGNTFGHRKGACGTPGCTGCNPGKATGTEVAADLSSADHRAAVIAEALGDGPDLTEDEQRVLAILTDADVNDYIGYNGDDIEDVVESLERDGSGYDMEDLRSLAQRLEARTQMDSNDNFTGTMSFEADGEAGSYTVGVYCGHDVGYLSTSSDLKYLSPNRGLVGDEDVSGLRKAVRIASVIDGDFNMMKSRAVRLGLVPKADRVQGAPDPHDARDAIAAFDRAVDASAIAKLEAAHEMREQLQRYVDAENAPRPSVWPENAAERAAFEDYQFEVANGDTAVSFRDWYTQRQEN